MQKSTTPPSTSHELNSFSDAPAAHRSLEPTHYSPAKQADANSDDKSTLGGNPHSSARRSCSLTCVVRSTRPSLSNNAYHHHHDAPQDEAVFRNDRVFFGWLFIESNRKREFKWRFCILDGAQFSYFSDNRSTSQRLGHHFLTGVERLHCINRGLMLIDDEHRRIWAHASHEIAEFEDWVAAFRAAIAYERKRRDGSIFERPHRRSLRHDHGPITQLEAPRPRRDAFDVDATANALNVSFTGWLYVRKRVLRLNWLFSSATRLYFVLSQRHLSGFSVNQEGRWVDFYGKIATARLCKRGFWLELVMDDGQRIRIASCTPATTAKWHKRITSVLQHEGNE